MGYHLILYFTTIYSIKSQDQIKNNYTAYFNLTSRFDRLRVLSIIYTVIQLHGLNRNNSIIPK